MGKITLSFALLEKENYLFYIYDVITWEKFHERFRLYYLPPAGTYRISIRPPVICCMALLNTADKFTGLRMTKKPHA